MQPGDALTTAAQVAVALAGFAGVVVAFRSEAVHQWQPLDKLRLWLLLTNSILPLGYCLFAIQLLVIQPEPAAVWRICSGVALVCDLAFAFTTSRGGRELKRAAFEDAGSTRFILLWFGVFGAIALVLQLVNLRLNSFWPFFTTIFIHLLAGAFQFTRMIILRSQSTS